MAELGQNGVRGSWGGGRTLRGGGHGGGHFSAGVMAGDTYVRRWSWLGAGHFGSWSWRRTWARDHISRRVVMAGPRTPNPVVLVGMVGAEHSSGGWRRGVGGWGDEA